MGKPRRQPDRDAVTVTVALLGASLLPARL